MTTFTRADRVSGLIQQVLSDLLNKNIKDPRLKMVTITGVKMTRDLKLARIYFSTPEGAERIKNAEKGFKSAQGYVKRTLARELGLRYMPELKFFYDESFDYGIHIEKILKKLNQQNGSDITPFNQQ